MGGRNGSEYSIEAQLHGKAFTHRIPRIEGHQIVSRKQKIGSRRIDYRMRNSDCELLNLETGEFRD